MQEQNQSHHQKMAKNFKVKFFASLVLTLPILILSENFLGFFGIDKLFSFRGYLLLLWLFSTLVFFYGGWPFLSGAYKEIKKKSPGMMTLIGLAVSVAYGYSSLVLWGLKGQLFFWELATLVDVMLLGHWIEMRSVLSASKALESLAKLIPSEAHLITDGEVKDVPVSKLNKQDLVLIKPGEKIPADGKIVEGETSVNESLLTGESKPVSKEKGQEVIGGSVNKEGSIQIEITGTGSDSYISQVVNLVKEAQRSKSKTQGLADQAARWLTFIAIGVGLVTLSVWLAIGSSVNFAVSRMVTVMVITCPHALGLAIPLVTSVSTSLSAQNGYLIRNRTAFEKARNMNAVVFDKTGTLTKGEFGVTDVISLDNHSRDEILSLAASLESKSEHSIGHAIVEEAKQNNLPLKQVDSFKNIPGKGVEGEIEGEEIKVVGENYLKEENVIINNNKVDELKKEGKSISYLLVNGEVEGAIFLSDKIRQESYEAIKELQSRGIKCIMMTGDNEKVAKAVSKKLKLDDYYAGVLPDEKSSLIKKIQNQYSVVAMVGDGVNDAPALVQADVGIAIGAGTDVAVESADLVLAKNDPRGIMSIIKISQATYSKMKQNLGWATGYNVIAIPLAAGVLYRAGILLSPAVGAILMSLSTVIVAINARTLRIK